MSRIVGFKFTREFLLVPHFFMIGLIIWMGGRIGSTTERNEFAQRHVQEPT